MTGRCVIFAAGQMDITPLLPRPEQGDFIIAADAGIRNAAALGAAPNLVMGDMDSAAEEEVPEGALLFPVRKDDTDLMLAIKKGIEKGYQDFLIYGATGGRLDHTIASIQSLSYLLSHGCRGILVDGEQWVTLIRDGTVRIPDGYRHVCSLFLYRAVPGCNAPGAQLPAGRRGTGARISPSGSATRWWRIPLRFRSKRGAFSSSSRTTAEECTKKTLPA